MNSQMGELVFRMKKYASDAAIVIVLLCSFAPATSEELESLCAEVQISISQEASLERQAFEASMVIRNSLDTLALENVSIELTYKDAEGNLVEVTNDPAPSAALFFERLDDTVGISDVDGNGSIPASTSAEVRWLIIPTAGAAGQDSNGKLYFVGANLSYTFGGEPQSITVVPDTIVVRPQPLLTLDYFLTSEVIADDAFTPEIEPPVPYTLGVRVKNNGYGTANTIHLESAQPRIVENEEGLAIGFKIVGSFINDQPATKSLGVNFGDIPSGQSSVARFVMESTLSGEFTAFTASVTHADTLGGELTSLIEAANTSLLVHDVLVDVTGRDLVNDFLAINEEGYRVYESEPANTLIVGCQDCAIVIPLAGSMDNSGDTSGVITRTVNTTATPGFIYLKWEDPFAGEKQITKVVRDDGKVLRPENFWLSQSRADDHITFDYYLNLFDTNGAASYVLTFDELSDVPVPPSIAFMPDRTTFEGSQVGFLMQATDANGTVPMLTVQNVPTGASFTAGEVVGNVAKGTFHWLPQIGQAGSYPVTFTASDGALFSTQTVTITVNPAGDVDGDGLLDAWEEEYFGDLSRDGCGDFDGDGYTDREEHDAETDPTVATTGIVPPEPLSPYYADVVDSNTPLLVVENSSHGQAANIRYLFELFDATDLTSPVGSATVEEGASRTEVLVDSEFLVSGTALAENVEYVWRVRSYLLPAGLDYSEWQYGAFRVNVVAEAPSAPALTYPDADDAVDNVTPELVVLAATDPDGDVLRYRISVFPASAWDGSALNTSQPLVSASGLSADVNGEVVWQTGGLVDGDEYYWLATAIDPDGHETDSSVGHFVVDASNTRPTRPAMATPLVGSEVATTVTLSVFNSTDVDSDLVGYEFELDTGTGFDSASLMTSGIITEGATTTDWQVSGLTENQNYYWRVRSRDVSGTSRWRLGRFVVNEVDEAPDAPIVLNPADLASVATVEPALVLAPGQDADGAAVSYVFNIYSDEALTSPIATNTVAEPRWLLDIVLGNNTTYYWTAQLQDAVGLLGPQSPAQAFTVADDLKDHAPSVEFVLPDVDKVTTGGEVLVQWRDQDPDSHASVELYATPDGGAPVLLVTRDEDRDAEDDQFTWDLSGLQAATYVLSLAISDDSDILAIDSDYLITLLPAERTISATVVGASVLEETGEALVEVDVVLDVPLATGTQLTLNASVSDKTEAAIVGATNLTFTDSTWNVPQRLTLKGVDDCEVDGDQAVSLVLSPAMSDDPDYNGVDPDDIALSNLDNEVPGQVLFICSYQLQSQTPAGPVLVDYTYQPGLSNQGSSLEDAAASVTIVGTTMALVSAGTATFPVTVTGTTVGANESITIRLDPSDGFDPAKLVWVITPGATVQTTEGTSANNIITGTDGDDVIDGKAGNDTLYGGDGDDVLIGGPGADTMFGGERSDVFIVTGTDAYADTFYGEGGYDRILGSDGDDTVRVSTFTGIKTVEEIDGGLGDNVIEGTNANNVMDFSNTVLVNIKHIDGLAGNDTITGSQAADVIIGNTGNDYLYGEGGDDVFPIWGAGSGIDRFNGGEGTDIVLGSVEDDVISMSVFSGSNTVEVVDGNGGTDIIQGTNANNVLDFSSTTLIGIARVEGAAGNDTLTGANEADVIVGGPGNDTLYGGDGDDVFPITGDEGTDVFTGGNGLDTIKGSPIDDVFRFSVYNGSKQVEVIDGDGGDNIIQGTNANNVLDFSTTNLISISHIDGVAGNDTITGTALSDVIVGGAGNDTLYGGDGNDLFLLETGDDGIDVYNGGGGIDAVQGSQGEDIIRLSIFSGNKTVEIIDGGEGTNTIVGTAANNVLDFSQTTLVNISGIFGGDGNDTLTGSDAADVIVGELGSDVLIGGDGDDVFPVTAGDTGFDRYVGGDGIDTILGTDGDDMIRISTYSGDNRVEIINGGDGYDTIVGSDANNVLDLSGTTLISIESLGGSAGNDTLTGTDGPDTIDGNLGSDVLFGGGGDDIFPITAGDTGFDRYVGGDGMDTVLGTEGDDVIYLSAFSGANTVELIDGGSGANTIVGSSANNVLDFSGTTLANIAWIDGGDGNDTITGTASADVIMGNQGSDVLDGGDGDDQFLVTEDDTGANRYIGGAGLDTLLGTDASDVIRLSIFAGDNTVETIDGGPGENTIVGTSANNTLDFSGTTLLNIAAIDGDDGNDTITGSASADVIIGGPGSDVLFGGDGDDVFRLTAGDTGYDRYVGGEGTDGVLGTDADDEIRLSTYLGTNTVETIDGGPGINTIVSSGANNTLDFSSTNLVNIALIDGGAGNDTITGSGGSDVIVGNEGSDVLIGGDGDDVFQFTAGDSGYDRYVGGNGQDRVLGTSGSDVFLIATFTGDSRVELIDGDGGADSIVASNANNTLDFSEATLVDIVLIDGGLGNDVITGSSGGDVIRGNVGTDTLVGLAGSDTYRVERGDGIVLIADQGDASDVDVLELAGGVTPEDVWLVTEGNHLMVHLLGGSDQVRLSNWYVASEDQVEEFRTDGGHVLLKSQVQDLVSVMAPMGAPVDGFVSLTPEQQAAVDAAVASTWGSN